MRGIESCFDHDAPSVGQFHPQPAACRHGINQFNRQQLCGWSYSAGAYPLAIIVQRVNRHTTRFAECFPPQPALFKIPHQTFRFRLAPTTSTNNRSRITHASTSTRHQLREKSGFARMHTVSCLLESVLHHALQSFPGLSSIRQLLQPMKRKKLSQVALNTTTVGNYGVRNP
jgi:hypothetical protein